jgi:hypothetical protein
MQDIQLVSIPLERYKILEEKEKEAERKTFKLIIDYQKGLYNPICSSGYEIKFCSSLEDVSNQTIKALEDRVSSYKDLLEFNHILEVDKSKLKYDLDIYKQKVKELEEEKGKKEARNFIKRIFDIN